MKRKFSFRQLEFSRALRPAWPVSQFLRVVSRLQRYNTILLICSFEYIVSFFVL